MLETVKSKVSGYTVAIVVCMIHPFGFFARIDADQDGIPRADGIAECPQEWGDLMSPEVSQTRSQPQDGLWTILDLRRLQPFQSMVIRAVKAVAFHMLVTIYCAYEKHLPVVKVVRLPVGISAKVLCSSGKDKSTA
jgi:hypothetical protein